MKTFGMICVSVALLATIFFVAVRMGVIPANVFSSPKGVVADDAKATAVPPSRPEPAATPQPPPQPPSPPPAASRPIADGKLSAAIFVQNRASADFQKYSGALTDLITTKLTEKGLSIIDKDLVVAAFKDAAEAPDAAHAEQKARVDNLAAAKTEATVENVLSRASALRLAQMINADYLVVASITSVGSETHKFNGKNTSYGVTIESKTYNMRVSLRILDRNKGGTFYGKTVTATKTVPKTETSETDSTDLVNGLLDDASTQIAEQLNPQLTLPVDTLAPVEFALACNIVNATVELDGAVIGSVGPVPAKLLAMPGLHHMRVAREWFATWDKDVNIFANQTLSIQLELSDVGFKRSKDSHLFAAELEKEKAELALSYQEMALRKLRTESQVANDNKKTDAAVAIAQVQSEADAFAKKHLAEGWKTCLEHSTLPTEERSRLEKEVNVFMGR